MALFSNLRKLTEQASQTSRQLIDTVKDAAENIQQGITFSGSMISLRKKFDTLRDSHNQMILSFKEYLPGLKAYKQAAITNELLEEMDRTIHIACYKSGGIAFFAENLVRYVDSLPAETPSAEQMWIGAFNTCILPIRELYAELKQKLAQQKAVISELPKKYADTASVLKTVGYIDPTVQIGKIEKMLQRLNPDPEELTSSLAELERMIRQNESALQTAKICSKKQIQTKSLENAELLRAMRAVSNLTIINQDTPDILSLPEGDPESYRKALESCAFSIREILLRKMNHT